MFRVPMCGAADPVSLEDPELLLPKNFRDVLASDVEDLPKSLRQDDPPPLLESILKLEVVGIFAEKCLKHLWMSGIQPTMMPIDISANLNSVSKGTKGRSRNWLTPKVLLCSSSIDTLRCPHWGQAECYRQGVRYLQHKHTTQIQTQSKVDTSYSKASVAAKVWGMVRERSRSPMPHWWIQRTCLGCVNLSSGLASVVTTTFVLAYTVGVGVSLTYSLRMPQKFTHFEGELESDSSIEDYVDPD